VLDKPAGLTSHDCVARVRRAYRPASAWAMAAPSIPPSPGCFPSPGPATRLLPYLNGDKAYRGVIQLGLRTSSDDLGGRVLERRSLPPLSLHALETALNAFRGPILQRPPQVSAVHVQGERAYARARRGELSDLKEREVTIERLELLSWDAGQGLLELEVRCGAGTYIRSLARDLGDALGCGGALAKLRRTEALGFDLSAAVSLEDLEAEPPPPPLRPPPGPGAVPSSHAGASRSGGLALRQAPGRPPRPP
jgi:tRNA pseudouridine55 synthase